MTNRTNKDDPSSHNLAAGGHGSGFFGPKLKRNEPVWAQANAEVGPALWEKTEQLVSGLTAGA